MQRPDNLFCVSMNHKANTCSSGNQSFRQRVSLPTYEVDSPTSNVSSPTPLNYSIQGHFCPYTRINYSSFFYPRVPEPNKRLNMCTQNLTPYNLFLVLPSMHHTTYSSLMMKSKALRRTDNYQTTKHDE